MQALFIFALYGLFFATVAGLIGHLSLSTQNLLDRQVADTRQFMVDVAVFYQDYITQQNITVPQQANFAEYLTENEVSQGVNWLWAENNRLVDPWGTEFEVYAVYEDHAIVGGAGRVVQPRAFAMVIASAGPNREFTAQVTNDINALTPASAINNIMRIEAPADSDDIVYTFNTRRALEKRWKAVENAFNELASIAGYQYQQDFYNPDFRAQLQTYYNWLYSTNLTQDINEQVDTWRAARSVGYGNWAALQAVAPDTFNYSQEINAMDTRDNTIMSLLEKDNSGQGTNARSTALSVVTQAQASSATYMISDILRLELTAPANSAWTNTANQFGYHIIVSD